MCHPIIYLLCQLPLSNCFESPQTLNLNCSRGIISFVCMVWYQVPTLAFFQAASTLITGCHFNNVKPVSPGATEECRFVFNSSSQHS